MAKKDGGLGTKLVSVKSLASKDGTRSPRATRADSIVPYLSASHASHTSSKERKESEKRMGMGDGGSDLFMYDMKGRRVTAANLEPTYRLKPKHNEKFRADAAKVIIDDLLMTCLTDKRYVHAECAALCKNIADRARDVMKHQGFSRRYKYVCFVVLGENTAPVQRTQGVQMCSRCLWATDTDNVASSTFQSDQIYAVCTVHACYRE